MPMPMTFKEFLEKFVFVHSNVILVVEYNEKGEFVQKYTSFGLDEPMEGEEDTNLYCLWADGDSLFGSTYIDLDTPVVLINNQVCLHDTNDVPIKLEFVRGDVITFDDTKVSQ